RRSLAGLLDGEKSATQPALTQLYRQTMATLAESDPQALKALELVVHFQENTPIFLPFLIYALGSALDLPDENNGHLAAIAMRAVNALYRRFLVSSHDAGHVTMPQLALVLIRHLTQNQETELRSHVRKGLLKVIRGDRENRKLMALDEFLDRHLGGIAHLAQVNMRYTGAWSM